MWILKQITDSHPPNGDEYQITDNRPPFPRGLLVPNNRSQIIDNKPSFPKGLWVLDKRYPTTMSGMDFPVTSD